MQRTKAGEEDCGGGDEDGRSITQTGGVGQVVTLSVPSEEDSVTLPCDSCPMSCKCSLENRFCHVGVRLT